jgi:hypothetical protein
MIQEVIKMIKVQGQDTMAKVIEPRLGSHYTMIPIFIFDEMEYFNLSDRAKALLPYLCGGPGSGRSKHFLPPGIHKAPIQRIAGDMQWTDSDLRGILSELVEAGWALTDEANGLILIPSIVSRADNPDHLTSTIKKICNLPDSPLRQIYFNQVVHLSHLGGKEWKTSTLKVVETLRPEIPDSIDLSILLSPDNCPTWIKLADSCLTSPTPCGAHKDRDRELESPQREIEDTEVESSDAEVLELLKAIHPEGDLWSICAFGSKKKHTHQKFRDHTEALHFAKKMDTKPGFHTVSWGLASLHEGTKGRGKASDVHQISTLWVDIDAEDENGDRDPSLALENLRFEVDYGYIPSPSAVVKTGGGVYVV